MTRKNALAVLIVLLAVSAGYADVRVFTVSNNLARVQNQLLVSQKASTQTRVLTVGQRCGLTRLILGVLIRVRDRADAAPFEASLRVCQSQLASVKRINSITPDPRPR